MTQGEVVRWRVPPGAPRAGALLWRVPHPLAAALFTAIRGHAGWRDAIRLWEQVATLSFVTQEVLDLGGPCFTVLMWVKMTGAESGASVPPVQAAWTYTLRRGLIVRLDARHDGWDAAPAELAAALQREASATEKAGSSPA